MTNNPNNITMPPTSEDTVILGERGREIDHWQPIETAPKDGTRVLLFTTTEGDEELTSYMSMIDGHPSILETVQIGRWTDEPFGDDHWECENIGNPTHWMPLPKPPLSVRRSKSLDELGALDGELLG